MKTNPRKKWPQFLCNTLFVENKNVTELISDFYFYFQFLFLVEYFRIILENVQHYFRYIFSFISDFFFQNQFLFLIIFNGTLFNDFLKQISKGKKKKKIF